MKQSRLLSLVLGLSLLAGSLYAREAETPIQGLPAYGKDKPLVLPQVSESRLSNGLTLWLIERPGLPLVSMYLAVKGGQASDPDDFKGLSDILSNTLNAGTDKRNSRQIAEQLQALGADMEVGVGKDLTYVGIDGLSAGADHLLEILADTTRNARFPEREVTLAIENQLQSIIASKSQPSYDLNQVFYRQLFDKHPYAFVNPDPAVIRKITRNDLLKVYSQRFQPNRAILIMVGNLPTREMTALAQKHFSDWHPHKEKIQDIPAAPNAVEPALLLLDRPHSVQSTIYVGSPMPGANNPDEFALEVANTLFGGAFGSRLTMNIREDKGYTYSPRSSVSSWRKGGVFRTSASVRNEVTAATLVEIFYELDRLATTLPEDEELSRAQRYLKGRFLLANETSSSMASTLTDYWIDGKTPQDLARYVPGIENIRAPDIQKVGRQYFASRKQAVAISGDASSIKDQLGLFGKVRMAKP